MELLVILITVLVVGAIGYYLSRSSTDALEALDTTKKPVPAKKAPIKKMARATKSAVTKVPATKAASTKKPTATKTRVKK
jgi:hypothetical protein